jgi:hypothetical protein
MTPMPEMPEVSEITLVPEMPSLIKMSHVPEINSMPEMPLPGARNYISIPIFFFLLRVRFSTKDPLSN